MVWTEWEKDIKNAKAITYKLRPALIRIINHRLKVARKKKQKKEEMVERQKTKAIITKCQKTRRRISLSSKVEKNYENNTKNKTDQDQSNNKYPLQL